LTAGAATAAVLRRRRQDTGRVFAAKTCGVGYDANTIILHNRDMKLRLSVLLLSAFAAFALVAFSATGLTQRLYLKDGTYQLVREYKVLEDRVRYLSAERTGEWEEIPLELVDLNRTKKEVAEHEAELAKETKDDADEANAIQEQKNEANYVPDEPGVYYVRGEKLDPLKEAEVTVVSDKKRTVLKILSPMPVVAAKNTVELATPNAQFRVAGDRPEVYFRLNTIDAIAIIKLAPKKGSREVETVKIDPITKMLSQDRVAVPTFTRQVGEMLFKIWPEQPMTPGEYALIEYQDEQGVLQVWDFGVGEPPTAGK
jgi:hypothetical protein